jgi:hypothetical protein
VHLFCRWDYAIEERDAEIDELKRRLVEAEHRAKEAASKAAEELQVLNADLQVGQGFKWMRTGTMTHGPHMPIRAALVSMPAH